MKKLLLLFILLLSTALSHAAEGDYVNIYARGSLNGWGATSEYQFKETNVPYVYVWQKEEAYRSKWVLKSL